MGGRVRRQAFDFDHRSSIDLSLQALLAVAGRGVMRMHNRDQFNQLFRAIEHVCAECMCEIPPGREGRRCKACREKNPDP